MLTIVLLLVLAAVVGVQDMRQVVYLSLHISYCIWWLLPPLPGKMTPLHSDHFNHQGA